MSLAPGTLHIINCNYLDQFCISYTCFLHSHASLSSLDTPCQDWTSHMTIVTNPPNNKTTAPSTSIGEVSGTTTPRHGSCVVLVSNCHHNTRSRQSSMAQIRYSQPPRHSTLLPCVVSHKPSGVECDQCRQSSHISTINRSHCAACRSRTAVTEAPASSSICTAAVFLR